MLSIGYSGCAQKIWVQLGDKNSGLPEKLPHSFSGCCSPCVREVWLARRRMGRVARVRRI